MADKPDLPYLPAGIMRIWDRLPRASQERLIAKNARDAAKAERDAKVPFDRAKEKERGKFARRLTKWLDGNYRKLPSNEAGIAAHQALVAEYEALYGTLGEIDRATHEKTYANIRRAAVAETERQAQQAEQSRLTKARLEREAEERERYAAAHRAKRDADRATADAKRTVRAMTKRIEYLEWRVGHLTRQIAGWEASVALLTDEYLETYRGHSGHRDLIANRKKMEGWLARDRPKLKQGTAELADCRERLAAAKAHLDPSPTPPPANAATATGTATAGLGWRPVWSKQPLAKYRELLNIPERWDMRKVVLIWFGEDRQELRVFSLQQDGYQTRALIELTGSGDLVELSGGRGAKWDFALTREQYDNAAA